MKRLILAAVLLMTGLSPGMAQNMSQMGYNYVAPPPLTPRETAIRQCFQPWDGKGRQACIDRASLESDLAKPCTRDAPFGCRTGTAK